MSLPNSTELMATAIKLLQAAEQMSGKKATGTPAAPWLHGPSGLVRHVDGEHPVLSAMVQPYGLLSVLPILRSDRHVTEHMFTFTGVTASVGSEPEGICDTPPEAGLKKLCELIVPFGLKRFKTREWTIARLGNLADRHEELSLGASFPMQLLNGDNLTPAGGIPSQGDDVFRFELADRLFEVAVAFQRYFSTTLYTADPLNNQAGDNPGYMEPIGLDLWINAGNKRDARSSAVCTALNSELYDFNYNKVDDTDPSIVRYITHAWRKVNFKARHTGLDPATWVLGMRPDLFFEIADIWPCSYLSHRCSNDAGTNIVVVNDDVNVRMRDEMRNGNFLWIDGVQVPVVTDGGIVEEDWQDNANILPGEWASDIYGVPLTVLNGRRVTGFQYFPQDVNVAQNALARLNNYWTTDGGMYLWNSTFEDLCLDMRALVRWRLLMQTPQLGFRIQNVKYAPLDHTPDWDPAATYHQDGGVTNTVIETFYNMWSSTPA